MGVVDSTGSVAECEPLSSPHLRDFSTLLHSLNTEWGIGKAEKVYVAPLQRWFGSRFRWETFGSHGTVGFSNLIGQGILTWINLKALTLMTSLCQLSLSLTQWVPSDLERQREGGLQAPVRPRLHGVQASPGGARRHQPWPGRSGPRARQPWGRKSAIPGGWKSESAVESIIDLMFWLHSYCSAVQFQPTH